jgi:archaellum component FlaC
MSYPQAKPHLAQHPPNYMQSNYATPPVEKQANKKLPFQKLNMSDAIGLVTLRLGKIEQWIIDNENTPSNNGAVGANITPAALSELMNRIERVEASSVQTQPTDQFAQDPQLIESVVESMKKSTEKMQHMSEVYDTLSKKVVSIQSELAQIKSAVRSASLKNAMFETEIKEELASHKLSVHEIAARIDEMAMKDTTKSTTDDGDLFEPTSSCNEYSPGRVDESSQLQTGDDILFRHEEPSITADVARSVMFIDIEEESKSVSMPLP